MTANYEEVAKRAFEIWESYGHPVGQDLKHWLQAENELGRGSSKPQKARKMTSTNASAIRTPKRQNAPQTGRSEAMVQ